MGKSYETIQPVPFGGYQLVERLAMGGMAEVYLARPDGQERFVALKRILPQIAADDEFIAMFIDEAKIAGQLNHPNVAQILDLGKIDKSYFIAMEYISGHDLRILWDRTRENATGRSTMPIGLACYVVKKLCDGLDFAHRKRDAKGRPLGIIHRDVSPQNILISYEGDLKIIDFGIAKASNRLSKTQTGILKGKFAYMAPEQARGELMDHRADIFAIGVILYELLTGERAFKADSDFALLEKVRRVDIVTPRSIRSEIPRDLERIVYKALAKEAGDRYAWASALAADLDRFMSDVGHASSKEELGGFVQRCFKAEYAEEKERLAAYRALFDDDESQGRATSKNRNRPISLGSDEPLDPVEGDRAGTQAGYVLGSSIADVATSFEEGGDTAALPRSPGPPSSSAPETAAELLALRNQAKRIAAQQAPERPPYAASDEADDDDEIDASEEASAVGAPVVSGTHPSMARPVTLPPMHASGPNGRNGDAGQGMNGRPREDARFPRNGSAGSRPARLDETEIELDASAASVDPAPTSSLVRDELPKKLRGAAKAPPAEPAVDEPSPRSDGASRAERSVESHAPDRPERSARAQERSSSSRGPRPRTPRPTSSAALFVATLVGALAGGAAVGLALQAIGAQHVSVVFVTSPREAEVREGEIQLCARTPCAVPLATGKHELIFRAPGAEELSKSVDVTDEGTPSVDVVLERVRNDIRLETTPPGAGVAVDDVVLPGVTPLTLPRLVVGRPVRLKLNRDGFEPLEISHVVDDRPVWTYDLPTATTVWTVSAEPSDSVFDGPGRERDGKLVVTVGKKSAVIKVRRPGCEERTLTLVPSGRAEAEQQVQLDCRKMDAGLILDLPRRVQVKVDGIDVKRPPGEVPYPLPAGPWTVSLRGSRGRTETRAVELRAGETVAIPTRIR